MEVVVRGGGGWKVDVVVGGLGDEGGMFGRGGDKKWASGWQWGDGDEGRQWMGVVWKVGEEVGEWWPLEVAEVDV